MVQATWKGKVIAESDQTTMVEGNHYFPEEDVDFGLLRASATTTECSWKGTASYYDIVVDGEVNKDAAWVYETPKPKANQIRGRIAFWKGVEIHK